MEEPSPADPLSPLSLLPLHVLQNTCSYITCLWPSREEVKYQIRAATHPVTEISEVSKLLWMSDDDELNWQQESEFLEARNISEQQGKYLNLGVVSCFSGPSDSYSWFRLQDKTEIVSYFHPCPQFLNYIHLLERIKSDLRYGDSNIVLLV